MPCRLNRLACIFLRPNPANTHCTFGYRFLASGPIRGRDIASILALTETGGGEYSRPIEIVAHVRTIRKQKRRSFVELGDGSTTVSLQALLDPNLADGSVNKIPMEFFRC